MGIALMGFPFRKRMKRFEGLGHARYLTFSCYQRLPLLNNDRIKQVFVDRLHAVRLERPFQLWAWVIMPEHVHLLIFPRLPEHPVDTILHSLKRPVAEKVLGRWKQINAEILNRVADRNGRLHFWQTGGGYDRNIASEDELWEKVTYIHENPVRRGLVDRAIDWPWSGARWYAGRGDCLLEIDEID